MKTNFDAVIVRDSGVCGGQAVVKGTRVTVRIVIAFAAASAEEDVPVKGQPLPV